MRGFRIVLLALGALLALAVVCIGGLYAYAAIDREDKFFVVDAQPLDPDYLLKPFTAGSRDAREHLGHGVHRLQRGRGIVLAERFYSNGSVNSIDDEYFRKLTVWIPGGPPQAEALFDLSDRANVLVFLSQGGSAWPRDACSGHVSTGTMRVARKGARYQVSLHGQFSPHGNAGSVRDCKASPVDIEFAATELQFSKLTPWLGSADGKHPYAETYR